MQYKGSKQIKRVAAIILSAALLVTELPNMGIAYAAENTAQEEVNAQEQESQTETASEQGSASESEAVSETETERQSETASEQETESQTEDFSETETEKDETATTEEASEEFLSETETETETELTLQSSVPVPTVDTAVYEYTHEAMENGAWANINMMSEGYEATEALTANEDGTYSINSKEQFVSFLTDTAAYADKTVSLECDVDMQDSTTTFAATFSGKFDGKGHSINHVKMNEGLFKVVAKGAEVKNLHISNVTIDGNSAVGVITADNKGTISNCVVSGTLTATREMYYTAGIAGNNSGTISHCVFNGNITAAPGTEGAGKYIGGITGDNFGTIQNCYAVGTIDTNAAVVAGIAASNSKTIENCANYMNVAGSFAVGGIASENNGSIKNCNNYGRIDQKDNGSAGQAGGIAAKNDAESSIEACFNYAEVKGAGNNIGGIAGYTAGSVKDCGNYGEVSGFANVGGIAGQNQGKEGTVISECFNKGSVAGTGNTTEAQGIGGILGSSAADYNASISNCYNTGSITVSASTKYIGGIAGILQEGETKSCYSTGAMGGITATSGVDNQYGAMIAGFIGEKASYRTSLYQKDIINTFCYKESGAVEETDAAKTADELKSDDAVTILGAGFKKDEGSINDGYPVLNDQTAVQKKYPVVYEPNGGCADYYFELVNSGETASEKSAPTKKNATFAGWYSDKELNNAFTSQTVTAPVTLYAKWDAYTGVEKVELICNSATLTVGEKYQIQVKYTPEDAKPIPLVWSTDAESVATVDQNGLVTAVANGDAKITVSAAEPDTTLVFNIHVSTEKNVIRFKDEKGNYIDRVTLAVGEKNAKTISAEIGGEKLPEGTTIQWGSGYDDKKAMYVQCVGDAGAIGGSKAILTGIKPTKGLASNAVKVTAIVKYPGAGADSCVGTLDVTVLPQATAVNVMIGAENASDKYAFYDLYTRQFVSIGTNKDSAIGATKLTYPAAKPKVSVLPSDASQKVEWTTNKPSVIDIDKDTGEIKGNTNGEAVITASAADGSNMTGKVTVVAKTMASALTLDAAATDKAKPIAKDEYGRVILTTDNSAKIVTNFVPVDVSDSRVSWQISNKDALKIDPATKIAKAKQVEEDTVVTVTGTTLDGAGVSGTIQFIIKPKVEKIDIYRADNMQNPVTEIAFNPDEEKSSIFELRAKNQPDNASQLVTWKSSNTAVVTVDDKKNGSCVVAVKGKGTAKITATATDGSGVLAATTVKVSVKASNIVITGSKAVMKGKQITLKAEIYPKSAADAGVKWKSLNPDIVEVVNPEKGIITGKKTGTAVVMATAADGSNVESSHTITVTDAIKKFDIIRYDGNSNPDDDEVLTGKAVGIDPDYSGNTYQLITRIAPETACQTAEWKSSNEKVVTVKNGMLTAVGMGNATVTATATDGSGKKVSVKVVVSTLSRSVTVTGSHYVGAGCSIQLKAEVGNLDAKNKKVNWSSQYPDIASVDKDGKVTAVKQQGHTIITAEAADGSGAKAEHVVYVMRKKDKVELSSADGAVTITEKSDKKTAKYDMSQNETILLRADCSGGSSEEGGFAKSIKWSTSDKKIATVVADASDNMATVTFIKAGTVTIAATANDGTGAKDSCQIKVTNTNPKVVIAGPKQVACNKKITLSTGNTAVTWESSDPSIATVNAKGQVKAKGRTGNVIITATAQEGAAVNPNFDTYNIAVSPAVTGVDITVNDTKVTKQNIGVDLVKGYNGGQLHLDFQLRGNSTENVGVTWKSGKTSVATVDSEGRITVKKAGTAKITATANDGSGKSAYITVVIAKQVEQIDSNDKDSKTDGIILGYGKSRQLSVTYKPLSATTKKVKWTSEDPGSVSVSSKGVIKAKRYIRNDKGYVTVTASAMDNSGAECEFRVYVTAPVNKVQITREGSEYTSIVGLDYDVNGAKINLQSKLTDQQGNVLTGLTDEQGNVLAGQKVTWKSSNTKIAKVDENGVVTGVAKGKATITATATDGSKKSGKVTVYVGKLITAISLDSEIASGISLKKGATKKISSKITITPLTATNQTLKYKSSNTKVATIDKNGKITAKGVGMADITVTTTDGSNLSKTFIIRVY